MYVWESVSFSPSKTNLPLCDIPFVSFCTIDFRSHAFTLLVRYGVVWNLFHPGIGGEQR